MKPVDLELERARRALDGPEAYPGELIETHRRLSGRHAPGWRRPACVIASKRMSAKVAMTVLTAAEPAPGTLDRGKAFSFYS